MKDRAEARNKRAKLPVLKKTSSFGSSSYLDFFLFCKQNVLKIFLNGNFRYKRDWFMHGQTIHTFN